MRGDHPTKQPRQERRQHVIEEHYQILATIVDDDTSHAETFLRMHISAVKDVLPAIVVRHPGYFETVSWEP